MPTSFLFIVNELPTNDDYPRVVGSIPPRMDRGRYYPPERRQGFLPPIPGYVFRWSDGVVSAPPDYTWSSEHRTIMSGYQWPQLYRAATVFYCNHFAKFYTARGDASTRDIEAPDTQPEDQWQAISFWHGNNISYVEHSGDQDFLAVRRASWIEDLLPNTYRRDTHNGPANGGLAGLLPIIISLVAFSCVDSDNLYRALIDDRAWTGDRWVSHRRENGRRERRGVVTSVYLDPENPQGSTRDSLAELEHGPNPIFQ